MARTTPVHSGYTIINGAGSGANGNRIDVWAEYKAGSPSVAGNYTPLTVYFYAALNKNYSSTTKYAGGLNSTCKVDGKAATGVTGGDYDFTSSDKVNFLGSYSGNIAHNTDGTKTVSLQASFTTKSSYITGGSVEGSVVLPAIPRKADITGVENALCGGACRVKWTPAVKSHTFTLALAVGAWEKTVSGIAPNTTALYTQTLELPLDIARQFSGATGALTVTLTTYQGTTALGSSEKTVEISVPENEDTRPQVTGEVFPVDSPFDGVYLQGKTRVGANISATDPLGATITDYALTVEGKSDNGQSPVSVLIDRAGSLTVTLTATNSRGFTGEYPLEIPVVPYAQPYFTHTVVRRSDLTGSYREDGESLYLEATAVCSPVEGRNESKIFWRAKPQGGSFTPWQELKETLVMEGTLQKDTPWTVELRVTDTVGGEGFFTAQLPSEQVYIHRPAGGKGLGLGGYVGRDDLLDIYWQVNARKPLTAPYINDRGICQDANTALAPGVYRLESAANCVYPQGLLAVFAQAGETAPVFQLMVSPQGKAAYRLRWQGVWSAWKVIGV